MSMSALGVFAVFFACLGLAFAYRPIFGLFAYLWIFYNDPQTHWWGPELPDLRYSLTAAAVATVAAVARAGHMEAWTSSGAVKLLLVFIVWCWIQTLWAVDVPVHLDGAILFTKYVVLSYVIWRICSDEENIELFLWAHVLGCAIFGWEGFSSTVSGRLETVGGPGVDDSNLLAAHMVTGLAIAGFLFIGSSGYKRWLLLAVIPFIMNGIILTQSRGGFLALCAAAVAAVYLAPRGKRSLIIGASVLGGVLFLMLVNDAFWERVETIQTADAQQEGRIRMLAPQFQMFLDYPLGAGHRGNAILSPKYFDASELNVNTGTRAAHNTIMAALVDHGVPGAIILLGLYAWGAVVVTRLQRLEKRGALSPKLTMYRAAIGTALFSLIVSGLFLNLLKTEVQIWLLTLLASVDAIAQRSAKQVKAAPVEAPQLAPTHPGARNV
jgi:hypothetical protein